MESKRQGGSSPSFTSELFGHREPPSTDVFASIFPPPKGTGRSSAGYEMVGSWQQHLSGSTRRDDTDKNRGSGYRSAANRERSSVFQEERVEPCHLSSSLYYGGQESYSQSQSSHTSASYTTFNKDAGEDDPTGTWRGNWWQGSLYY